MYWHSTGRLFDEFNSYDISFYMSGALIVVSAIGFCTLEMRCFTGKTQKMIVNHKA